MTETTFEDRRPKILLVDDEPVNLHVLRQILQGDYRLAFARDGHKALQLVDTEKPELILLDVMMPELSGLDVCRHLKADPRTREIPVIFVTALADESDEAEGLAAGAVDYVTKPVSASIVRARVKTHLSLVHMDALQRSYQDLVDVLGRASEYKDNDTGLHTVRMARFAGLIAQEAGLPPELCAELVNAASMHDVGKIGIPDAILRKPGKLDEAEWSIMRRHPEIGAQILGDGTSSLICMARRIALSHHERWDGKGYPAGLAGAAIPIEARIVAIADVFDALTSKRPYKAAWPIEKAVALIQSEAGKHFDPFLVQCFCGRLPEITTLQRTLSDNDEAAA